MNPIDPLPPEKKQEAGKNFLDFINKKDYIKALEYYEKLDAEAQKYIRIESNCSWGFIIANQAVNSYKI